MFVCLIAKTEMKQKWKAAITRLSASLVLVVIVLAVALGFVSYQYSQKSVLSTTTFTVTQTLTKTGQTASCVRVGEGWAFYIKVVSDASKSPVSGVKINARTYVHCGSTLDNTNESSLIEMGTTYSLATSANGTVQLPTAGVDGYLFTVFSSGRSYPFETFLPPGLITNATISVPSGNMSISYYYPPH